MASKIAETFRLHLERIRTAPGEELGSWAKLLRLQVRLWRFCARRLRENNVSAMSAALSFRTIFAMIPTLVLVVAVMQSVGVLEDSKQSLRRLLSGSGFAQITVTQDPDAGAPDAGEAPSRTINVADEVERIVGEVEAKLSLQRVGPVGVILLIWTALTLVTTIERSLNRVFGAHRPRPLGQRLLSYWAVLTLGPLVSVAAAYAGRQATRAVQDIWGLSWVLGIVGWAAPVVVGILVVAAIYRLLPHTTVRFSSALGGGVVSVLLWLVAKWGFGVYVTKLVGTGNLYGTLGLLPMFLLWLNLSWWIFLFGAQLAHTAMNLADLEDAVGVFRSPGGGDGPPRLEDVARTLHLPNEQVEVLLDRLVAKNILCPVEGGPQPAYVPPRPAEKIALVEVIGLDHPSIEPTRDGVIDGMLERARERASAALGSFTLADVIDENADWTAGDGVGHPA